MQKKKRTPRMIVSKILNHTHPKNNLGQTTTPFQRVIQFISYRSILQRYGTFANATCSITPLVAVVLRRRCGRTAYSSGPGTAARQQ